MLFLSVLGTGKSYQISKSGRLVKAWPETLCLCDATVKEPQNKDQLNSETAIRKHKKATFKKELYKMSQKYFTFKEEKPMMNSEERTKMSENGVCNTKYDPSRWMTDDEEVRNRTLDKITMLGSHDSGMSVHTYGTKFGTPDNTLTQVYDIAGQLNRGARYFDIRPCFLHGRLSCANNRNVFCGHFSNIKVVGLQGASGQSLYDIVDQVNEFCKDKKELVILDISKAMSIDTDYGKEIDISLDDWLALRSLLNEIKYLCKDNKSLLCKDYSLRKTLGELTAEGSAVVVVDRVGLNANFCDAKDFPVYDKYANSDSYENMKDDQFKKLKENGNNRNTLFLLSWTLTQQWNDILIGPSILSLAEKANSHMDDITDKVSKCHIFPNIVYIDKIDSNDGFCCASRINEIRPKS